MLLAFVSLLGPCLKQASQDHWSTRDHRLVGPNKCVLTRRAEPSWPAGGVSAERRRFVPEDFHVFKHRLCGYKSADRSADEPASLKDVSILQLMSLPVCMCVCVCAAMKDSLMCGIFKPHSGTP